MNINVLIDSLMVYAQENLLLDDLDLIFTRNRIIQRLNITDYEEYEISVDMIEGMQNPYQLLNQISGYAVENGIVSEDGRTVLETEIMTLLIKRPGEIADTFNDLMERSKSAKAFLWLSEYNLKSGYVKFHNILKHWEAKGTKGKIEVFIAKNTNEKINKYPSCTRCPEIEGFGKYRTMRRVPIELDGEDYFWQLEENPYVQGLGYAVGRDHSPLKINIAGLKKLFDFVQLAPNYLVVMDEVKGHGYFIGTVKQLPLQKAPELKKLKSSEYPYINIVELDWYTNVIRLTCTNREKLIELILKLNSAFAAIKEGNRMAVSLRKTDKYIVEILFLNSNMAVDEKSSNLFNENPDILALMGIVVLPETLDAEIKQMSPYLTKELKFTEAGLPDGMAKHKRMIAKILKEIGSSVISPVEAQIDIKEEINYTCEAALAAMRVFENTDSGTDSYNEFLLGVGIK